MSISANVGVGSLQGRMVVSVERLVVGGGIEGGEGAHPLTEPIHAPVAEPGLTKKRLSYSTAWNLDNAEFRLIRCAKRRKNARMCMSRDEHVDVELSRDGAERVEVARWYALVPVYDADPYGRVGDRHGQREITLHRHARVSASRSRKTVPQRTSS